MTEQTKEQTDYEKLQDIGRNAMNCIAEMVAALNCDYDRLEELMDERKALQEAFDDAETNEDPDDHATGVARADAELELKEWDAEHAEELAELIEAAGESESRQDAEQRIQEDPLSLEFRSGVEACRIQAIAFNWRTCHANHRRTERAWRTGSGAIAGAGLVSAVD